jgi:hypothetical protein
MMRTLGQEMDDLGISVDRIEELQGSYRVYGADSSGKVYRFYSRAELQHLSENRRAMRKSAD